MLNLTKNKEYTQAESEIISQLKRYRELLTFDKKFASLIAENPQHPDIQTTLKKVNIKLNVHNFLPLVQKEKEEKIIKICSDPKAELSDDPELESELADFPVLLLWIRWMKNSLAHSRSARGVHMFVKKNPRFDSWRKRRVAAAKSELGHFGNFIDHPIFAYELNRGCSVGCRFCAFAAQKLSATFEYTPENRVFWREILQVGVDLFGEAASLALCYYGTEPFDNPHYLEFIQDFEDVTKGITCTSTAAPLKNIEKFRSLVQYYQKRNIPWPQVSVLSDAMARKLHEDFTPDELRDVSLLDKTEKTDSRKAVSGKTMLWDSKKRPDAIKKDGDMEFIPQASISCVSGFLVNMVDHSIKLISPCKATEKYPFGYRTYAEAVFADVADYRRQLERIIEDKMKNSVQGTRRLAFRDDLTYAPGEDGFVLKSLYQTHNICRGSSLTLLGDLIAKGRNTYEEIAKMMLEKGTNALAIPGMIKNLYDQGFIDETSI